MERRRGDWTLGVESYDLTDTQDRWVIAEEENILAALFFRRDLRDYYRRRGLSLYGHYRPSCRIEWTAQLGLDEYGSLENEVDWGLFGSGLVRKAFRPNPAVDEGWFNGASLRLSYDSRNDAHHPWRGWLLRGAVEGGHRGSGLRALHG